MQKVLESSRNSVSVLVAEENEMNCQLVEAALRPRRYRVNIVGSAIDSPGFVNLLKERTPDVAVVSSQLREGPLQGFHVVRELRNLRPGTRIVMLLDTRERELVIDAFRCGAHGIVFRDEPLETLTKCIHAVRRGQIWANSEQLGYVLEALSLTLPKRLQDARGMDLLSKREELVVRQVAEGMTNREISVHLKLTENSVRNYLFKIFDKLGVSTRVELVLYCLQERQTGAPNSEN